MTASDRHIAEQGDFFAIVESHLSLSATDQNVGLNTDLSEQTDRMLRRFRLELRGRLQIRHQRQVDVEAIFLADVQGKLPDRFQERLAFDIADRAADFGNHDVNIVAGKFANALS